MGPVCAPQRHLSTPYDWSYDVPKPVRHPHGRVLYPNVHLTEPIVYTYGFTLFLGHKADITCRTHMTTVLQECDFIRTFHGSQIPTSPQVYEPETTRRSHVTHVSIRCFMPRSNESPEQFGAPGKELFIRFTARAFRKLLSIYVFSYFPFGFEDGIWDLIVSIPDHCLSFYCRQSCGGRAGPYLSNDT